MTSSGLRRPSRCSRSRTGIRVAREPRRGRAIRVARHLSRRLLRDPAAAICRGGVRGPGGQTNGRQCRPTARSSVCWSRTRPSTCATASCAATSGCSISARVSSAVTPSGSRLPGALFASRSTRLVSFTHRAVAGGPVRGRAARSSIRGGRPVRAGDQRDVARSLRRTRGLRRRSLPRCASEFASRRGCCTPRCCTRRKASSLTLTAAMDHIIDGPPDTQTTRRSPPTISPD